MLDTPDKKFYGIIYTQMDANYTKKESVDMLESYRKKGYRVRVTPYAYIVSKGKKVIKSKQFYGAWVATADINKYRQDTNYKR